MKPKYALLHLVALGLLASCSTTSKPQARLDDKTAAAIDAMSSKLASAKTLTVTATRSASSGYFLGDRVAEHAHIEASAQRPDKFHATLKTNRGTRDVVYDGRQLLLVDHKAQTHALTPAPPTFDSAVKSWHELYGYLPPLAELLVNDPKSLLLDGVEKGTYTGTAVVNGEPTEQYTFQQADFSWSLWISTRDGLPRKIESVYPNGEGEAPVKLTATISKWRLNAPVQASSFVIKEPQDSLSINAIPLNP